MEGFDDTNLRMSEVVVATILKHVAEQGLQSSSLSFDDLRLDHSHSPFFGTSVRWLLDEGIIRVTTMGEALDGEVALFDPMVTSRGMALLGRSILMGNESMPASKAVAEIANSESGHWKVGDLIGGVLGGFTKSMGN